MKLSKTMSNLLQVKDRFFLTSIPSNCTLWPEIFELLDCNFRPSWLQFSASRKRLYFKRVIDWRGLLLFTWACFLLIIFWLTISNFFTLVSPIRIEYNFEFLWLRMCPSYRSHMWGDEPKTYLKHSKFYLSFASLFLCLIETLSCLLSQTLEMFFDDARMRLSPSIYRLPHPWFEADLKLSLGQLYLWEGRLVFFLLWLGLGELFD